MALRKNKPQFGDLALIGECVRLQPGVTSNPRSMRYVVQGFRDWDSSVQLSPEDAPFLYCQVPFDYLLFYKYDKYALPKTQ